MNCKYCNREFKHQGALNLHQSIHCKSKNENKSEQKHARLDDTCDCKNPSFQLLNGSDRQQAIAIQLGYKKICTICQEVV